MNTVSFEITKDKTVVTIVSSTSVEKVDITRTDVEKSFVKLLKRLQDHRQQNEILDAINLDKWGSGQ